MRKQGFAYALFVIVIALGVAGCRSQESPLPEGKSGTAQMETDQELKPEQTYALRETPMSGSTPNMENTSIDRETKQWHEPALEQVELVDAGSLEQWTSAGQPEGWRIRSGQAQRTVDSTDGNYAMALMPGSDEKAWAQFTLQHPKTKRGDKLVVSFDAKADEPNAMTYQVRAFKNNKFTGISQHPTDPEGTWVSYGSADGTWQRLSHEIEITPEIDLKEIALDVMIPRPDVASVFIDNVSMMIHK